MSSRLLAVGSIAGVLALVGGLWAARSHESAAGTGRERPTLPTVEGPGVPADDRVGSAPEDREATAIAPTTYSVVMHIHGSVSEGSATMGWHTAQAITNHIDALWWSDHDIFYYPEGCSSIDGYDFESGSLSDSVTSWPSTVVDPANWLEHTETNPPLAGAFDVRAGSAHSGSWGGHLLAEASPTGVDERATWYISAKPSPRIQFKSLLGDVSLDFWVNPILTAADGELQVVVPLSGTISGDDFPMDEDYQSIVFYHGSTVHPSLSADGNTIYVPITASTGTWTEVTANLTDLATAAWGDAGKDLHAELITVRANVSNGASIAYDVDDFSWTMAETGADLVTEQANYLATLGGPAQYLGQEVSPLPEGHFNIFGSSVPFLPYATSDTWDAASLVDWAHLYGGLVSYNHMFGVTMTRGSEETRAAEVDSLTTSLTANAVWGADLIEIGYRQRNGLISDFLAVWDALGMAGIYTTGIGATDLHDKEQDFATFTNNFVTFVPSRSFDETSLITELHKGNAWFGDPTFFSDGHVTLGLTAATRPRATAGNVVVGQRRPVTVTFTTNACPNGAKMRLFENGTLTSTTTAARSGRQVVTATINPLGGNVVRFELLTGAGGAIAYTNPIYFVDEDSDNIPDDRRLIVR